LIDTAIIYTRTNSKRLNKKSLLPIYKNKSLIEKVVENTLRIKSINRIILATTNSKEDKIYEKLLKNYNINYFYGSTNNLIQRTIKCSKKYSFNYFLRVCGDRPFFSHIHIDKIISNFNKRKFLNYDLMSNNKKNKIVDQGLTIEILSAKSLEKLYLNKKLSKYNLENITSYFYENSKNFNMYYCKSPKNWFLNNKYTIDNFQDLEKMRKIILSIGYKTFNINKANNIIKKNDSEN
tara:strand:- start:903 stop:1610 length:708 start_codon:yes stop_codon:yes gene_type:complete